MKTATASLILVMLLMATDRVAQQRDQVPPKDTAKWTIGATQLRAGENRVRRTPDPGSSTYGRVAFSKPLARRARVLDTVGAALLSTLAW